MMPGMPGTNLTRDEAQTRARLLSCRLLHRGARPDHQRAHVRHDHDDRVQCTEPGAATFADLVGATIHEITLNGPPLDPAEAYADHRIALPDLPAVQRPRGEGRLPLLPHGRGPAPLRRPGRRPGLHLLPVRGAGRPPSLHHVRAARPEERLPLQRDRARGLEGRLQRPHPRAPSRSETARPSGASRPPSGCRPTSPRSSPASTTPSSRPTSGKYGEIPLGHYCRQSLVEHMDTEELVKLTSQGFEFFEEAFDYPYPFHKYDQLYVPEYNMGAMENAGAVTLRDEYLPRSRQDALVLRVPLLGDPPRDGAHVVRRPGHHEVVGRPLAQRVVRRVGLLPRRRRGDRVRRVLDRLHQRPQELGAAPGPAAQHPPDRGRQLRPAGRRGQLRRHHLRQGRLGAQAARRLGGSGQLPRRAAQLLPAARVRQLRVQRPAERLEKPPRAASWTPGPRSGCRPAA